MPITAECGSCHKRFKAPDKLVGKKVKCPQCGGVIPIPAPEPPKGAAPSAGSLLDEELAPARSAPKPARKCPSCGTPLADQAVLCVSCGFDLRTGAKLAAQLPPAPVAAGPAVTLKRKDWDQEEKKQEKAKKKRKKRRGELPQGIAFLRGVAVSFGAALIGSFMWFGLAYWLDVEMAIIAWVLGGLAGVGMMIGYGVEDVLAGFAAAAVALAAIFVAKVMIFAAFLGNPAHFMDNVELDEVAMEQGFDEGLPSEATVEEEIPGAVVPAAEGVSQEGFTEEGLAAEETSEEAFPDDAEVPEFEAPAGLLVVAAVVAAVISMFWPLWNILFLALACATAYQVGSGGGWLGQD